MTRADAGRRRPPCGGVDRNQLRELSLRLPASPPVRGRGSKLVAERHVGIVERVAPRAGAWIETRSASRAAARRPRRPPCGGVDRNLACAVIAANSRSPPVRGRGSKPDVPAALAALARRPPCGGVDRNRLETSRRNACRVAPPCGGVDRNTCARRSLRGGGGRPPCGGVDRNAANRSAACSVWTSPPVRGRGSKHPSVMPLSIASSVAPRAGAWIETPCGPRSARPRRVAPRAGAWIETPCGPRSARPRRSPPVRGRGSKHWHRRRVLKRHQSPPVRGRGSKPRQTVPQARSAQSPPVRGRGSKLRYRRQRRSRAGSPPVRGRGSKRAIPLTLFARRWSPPVRGRGSKLQPSPSWRVAGGRPPCGGVDRNPRRNSIVADPWQVAPRAGAWIETCGIERRRDCFVVAPPCGGVDRNNDPNSRVFVQDKSPPVRGRGSKLRQREIRRLTTGGRPPCGGVDRNHPRKTAGRTRPVAPRAGAWIETCASWRGERRRRCRPPCGGVDRNSSAAARNVSASASPPARGRGSDFPRSSLAILAALSPRV